MGNAIYAQNEPIMQVSKVELWSEIKWVSIYHIQRARNLFQKVQFVLRIVYFRSGGQTWY